MEPPHQTLLGNCHRIKRQAKENVHGLKCFIVKPPHLTPSGNIAIVSHHAKESVQWDKMFHCNSHVSGTQ